MQYIDLPKAGMRYISHKIKSQLTTFCEDGKTLLKTGAFSPSERGEKTAEIVENRFYSDCKKLNYNESCDERQLRQKSQNTVSAMFGINLGGDNPDKKTEESGRTLEGWGMPLKDSKVSTLSKAELFGKGIIANRTDCYKDTSSVEVKVPSTLKNKSSPASGFRKPPGREYRSHVPVNNFERTFHHGIVTIVPNISEKRDIELNNKCESIEDLKAGLTESCVIADANKSSRTILPSTPEKAKIVIKDDYEPTRQFKSCSTKPVDRNFTTDMESVFEGDDFVNSTTVVQSTPEESEDKCGNMKQHNSRFATPTVEKSSTNFLETNVKDTFSGRISCEIARDTPPAKHRQVAKIRPLSYKEASLLKRTKSTGNRDIKQYESTRKRNCFYSMPSVGLQTNICTENSVGIKQNQSQTKGNRYADGSTDADASQNKSTRCYSYATSNKHNSQVLSSTFKETSCLENKHISTVNTLTNATNIQTSSHLQSGRTSKNNTGRGSTICDTRTNDASSKTVNRNERKEVTYSNLVTYGDRCSIEDNGGGLRSDEDMFGYDDGLDEMLANSLIDNEIGESTSNDVKCVDNGDGLEEFPDNFDDDIDDDALVTCLDDVTSSQIRDLECINVSRANWYDSVDKCASDNKACDKIEDYRIKECPFCAKSFLFG